MTMQSAAIRMGRTQAELRMTDTCKITRQTGSAVDEATGVLVPVVSTIYEGKCRLKYTSPRVFLVESAGQLLAEERPILSIPVGATGAGDVIARDDVEMTGVDADAGDTSLVGVKLTIMGPSAETAATARRFPVTIVN